MDHARRTPQRAEPPPRSQSGFVDRFRLSMNVSGEPGQRPIGNPLRRWSPSPVKEPETSRHAAPTAVGGAVRAVPTSSPLGPERLSPVPDERRSASSTKKTQPPPRRLTEPVRRVGSPASLARRDLPAASPRQQPRSVAASPPRPVGSSPSPERRKPPAEPALKVGIVLMTRKPHRFDFWLRYHRSIGISRVFVHVEDTPELLALLETPEFSDFVTVTAGSDRSEDTHKPKSENNYYTLMERQERHVRASVLEARKRDIDWRVRAT